MPQSQEATSQQSQPGISVEQVQQIIGKLVLTYEMQLQQQNEYLQSLPQQGASPTSDMVPPQPM